MYTEIVRHTNRRIGTDRQILRTARHAEILMTTAGQVEEGAEGRGGMETGKDEDKPTKPETGRKEFRKIVFQLLTRSTI